MDPVLASKPYDLSAYVMEGEVNHFVDVELLTIIIDQMEDSLVVINEVEGLPHIHSVVCVILNILCVSFQCQYVAALKLIDLLLGDFVS